MKYKIGDKLKCLNAFDRYRWDYCVITGINREIQQYDIMMHSHKGEAVDRIAGIDERWMASPKNFEYIQTLKNLVVDIEWGA